MNSYTSLVLQDARTEINLKSGSSRGLKKVAKYGVVIILIGLLAGCSGNQIKHEYLYKGQVIETDGDEIVLCIGRRDGAEKGQELSVYRYIYKGSVTEGEDAYGRAYIGQITIDEIVDTHFARAKIISGEIKKHDVAELVRED